MSFKCGRFVGGIALACFLWHVAAFSQEKPVGSTAIPCRSVGEEFSFGGVPGPKGWDKSLINCCPGLIDRERKDDYPNDCKDGGLVGGYIGRCIACGDGICDERFENKCVCPEDCKER